MCARVTFGDLIAPSLRAGLAVFKQLAAAGMEVLMKRWGMMLGALAVTLLAAQPAEAGRRVRRAARTTAIVAAATGTAAVVAAAPRRTTVVAAATPTVVAATAVRTVPGGAPDLTIVEVVNVDDVLCVTVANIGTAASPRTRLQVNLARPSVGPITTYEAVVPALAINQAVRIRIRSAPIAGTDADFTVDPRDEVAELDERNNAKAIAFEAPTSVEAATLEAEVVWGQPAQ
jgi:hypothetical protein